MYLVRELFFCKPGQVRKLVDMFHTMNELNAKLGMPAMRIMTDFAAERYWTLVAEMEVESIAAFEAMMNNQPAGASDADMKKFDEIMKNYHDLVQSGKREIYKIETPKKK